MVLCATQCLQSENVWNIQPVQPSLSGASMCKAFFKVKAKSNWSVKSYIKADHNTIMLLGVNVMLKYKVLSKRESGMIKSALFQTPPLH